MHSFVVDVYTMDCTNGSARRRLGYDSLESALLSAQNHERFPNTTRVVVSRRLGGGGLSKMRVWTRDIAA